MTAIAAAVTTVTMAGAEMMTVTMIGVAVMTGMTRIGDAVMTMTMPMTVVAEVEAAGIRKQRRKKPQMMHHRWIFSPWMPLLLRQPQPPLRRAAGVPSSLPRRAPREVGATS